MMYLALGISLFSFVLMGVTMRITFIDHHCYSDNVKKMENQCRELEYQFKWLQIAVAQSPQMKYILEQYQHQCEESEREYYQWLN